MNNKILLSALLTVSTVGLHAEDTINMVDAEKRSERFEAVATKLDLGGEIYNFMDTDGYIEQMAQSLSEMMQSLQAAQAQGNEFNPGMFFATQWHVYGKHLGLFNVDAIGTSAYLDGELYRSKSYIYQPNGRSGLFTLMGDDAHSLELLKYAPEDTDYFYSADLTLARSYPIAKAIMTDVMGPSGLAMLEQGLSQPLPALHMTGQELLAQLDTEVALILRLGEPVTANKSGNSMPPISAPEVSATLVLRNMASLFDTLMQAPDTAGEITTTQSESRTYYSFPARISAFPLGNGAALVMTDSATGFAYLSTSLEYLDTCLGDSKRLAANASFQSATKGLPTEGNVFNFISTDIYKAISHAKEQTATLMPEASMGFSMYSMFLPIMGANGTEPASAMIGINEAQGTWFVANTPFRPASGAGAEAQAPVVVGLLAAMAIPAFQKVRANSQQKAVTNNLRQFASGGMQFMLEEGKAQASYEDIIGPNKYVSQLPAINGEDYSQLIVSADGGTLSVTMSNGETVSYEY